ncbi:MAG: dihydroorotate dehydrogenase electron transfer subunit [Candidatus Aenigmatarchaeota archaeon]
MSLGRKSERPRMTMIDGIVEEAEDTKSFWFFGDLKARPGQFVMVWIPDVGQKPFGISYQERGKFAITVRKVGSFTEKLFSLQEGEEAGIQGPYGNGFSGKGENAALVGGGYGVAPLAFLAERMSDAGKKVTLVNGAARESLLLYRQRFPKGSGKVKALYSTDDGSFGHKGFCTDCLSELLAGNGIDRVYCCGTEQMMKKVLDVCTKAKVPAEFSLDRYMKCGFGVCGSCCLGGTGLRVCRDGPVFTSAQLSKVTDFGRCRRDASGKKVDL